MIRSTCLFSGLAAALAATVASAQVTVRASVSSLGSQSNYHSGPAVVSANGRFVAFASGASNLVAGDTNGFSDVFLRDRVLATTERVSVSTSGVQGDFHSGHTGFAVEFANLGVSVSADGRFVVFESNASNLVAGDTNARTDVFLRDRQAGTTERVGLQNGGGQPTSDCLTPSVSDDGRYVSFVSSSNSLVSGDVTGWDVFVRDRTLGTTSKVSLGTGGTQGNNDSYALAGPGAMSNDGRYVVMHSYCSNFVAGDTNGAPDIFVYDRTLLVSTRVSVSSSGTQANAASDGARISSDGKFVAFASNATNLVTGDTNGDRDVFVRDLQGGTTICASANTSGLPGGGLCSLPFLSQDGRYVAFDTSASTLVTGDTNSRRDVFVRDTLASTTRLESRSSTGLLGNDASYAGSLSVDGRFVAVWGFATNLVAGDTNGRQDAFLRDLGSNNFVVYCTSGTSTNGCAPTLSASGTPSASAGAGFTLSATSLEGQKSGLIFYGTDNTGFTPTPWGPSSSFLCVKAPTQRSLPASSGGTAGACDGVLTLDWNALAVTPGTLGSPFAAGQHVFAQAWYRDPPSTKTTALSDAIEFVVEP